jgi:hypothetical protein
MSMLPDQTRLSPSGPSGCPDAVEAIVSLWAVPAQAMSSALRSTAFLQSALYRIGSERRESGHE